MMSLEKSGLFKAIVGVGQGSTDYVLDVDLIYASSHPGASMTAWVNANWVLIERESGDNVWSAHIKGEGHAGSFEAFSGMVRQNMTLERGAQANIDQALAQIQELSLRSP